MRKHYSPLAGKKYLPIDAEEIDYRAKRITDYLNMVQTIVEKQIAILKCEEFVTGSEIVKYFEMLPEECSLKGLYKEMLDTIDDRERHFKQEYLRNQIVAGSIDVNIMTKVDREHYDQDGNPIPDSSDAVAALRGYAQSNLKNSAVIFSAGLNPRLYNYLEKINDFTPNKEMKFKKRVIVKVSDYRSALIQGKYLSKKGIWVSEFRIESGLNCGGHAFATNGYLLGPILEEFKNNKQTLFHTLFELYSQSFEKKFGYTISKLPTLDITIQGGVGTNEEHKILLSQFNAQRVGWGTPFLLVPEATTVDPDTLNLLKKANDKDISLSRNSPLGVRFYYLHGSTAEIEKLKRIAIGKPGSPCTEKHLALNTEFTTKPICTASSQYQKLKLKQLESMQLDEKEVEKQKQVILDKECLCIGLSNSAAITYKEKFIKNFNAVNICPGPNITNFSEIVSLQKMTDHIYGRASLPLNPERPNMFIAELNLYVNYIDEKIRDSNLKDSKELVEFTNFVKNLHEGIAYYQKRKDELTLDPYSWNQSLNSATQKLIRIQKRIDLHQLTL
jgi:hypothetical protein